jgi:hypothetical protein
MSSLRNPIAPGEISIRTRNARLRALDPPSPQPTRRERRLEGYRGALALVALLTALIATIWLAPLAALEASTDAIAWLEARLTPTGQALSTTALGTVALLGLVIAWARRTALGRPLSLPAGGRVSVDDVALRLQQMIEERDDISSAEVQVDNLHRRGLRVSAQIRVSSHANLNGAIQSVSEATELLLHGHLLVRLSSPPSVEVHFDELDLRSGRHHDERPSAAHR